jgi:hypothetical protein
MKEARDLRLQEFPIKPSGRNSDPILVGLNFFASIDQYRVTGLIDKQTWKNFERDLKGFVGLKPIQDWLDEKPSTAPVLPSVTLFDPRFVAFFARYAQNRNDQRSRILDHPAMCAAMSPPSRQNNAD